MVSIGARVRVTRGRKEGAEGRVKYVGPTRFGEKALVQTAEGEVWVEPNKLTEIDLGGIAVHSPTPERCDFGTDERDESERTIAALRSERAQLLAERDATRADMSILTGERDKLRAESNTLRAELIAAKNRAARTPSGVDPRKLAEAVALAAGTAVLKAYESAPKPTNGTNVTPKPAHENGSHIVARFAALEFDDEKPAASSPASSPAPVSPAPGEPVKPAPVPSNASAILARLKPAKK